MIYGVDDDTLESVVHELLLGPRRDRGDGRVTDRRVARRRAEFDTRGFERPTAAARCCTRPTSKRRSVDVDPVLLDRARPGRRRRCRRRWRTACGVRSARRTGSRQRASLARRNRTASRSARSTSPSSGLTDHRAWSAELELAGGRDRMRAATRLAARSTAPPTARRPAAGADRAGVGVLTLLLRGGRLATVSTASDP